MNKIFTSFWVIAALLFLSATSTLAESLNSVNTLTFPTINPCTGREVIVSTQLHTNGDTIILANAKAYDPASPEETFPVVYNYGIRGQESRVFDVTFIIHQPDAGYQEHQLFQLDQNGEVTRVLVSKVCR